MLQRAVAALAALAATADAGSSSITVSHGDCVLAGGSVHKQSALACDAQGLFLTDCS